MITRHLGPPPKFKGFVVGWFVCKLFWWAFTLLALLYLYTQLMVDVVYYQSQVGIVQSRATSRLAPYLAVLHYSKSHKMFFFFNQFFLHSLTAFRQAPRKTPKGEDPLPSLVPIGSLSSLLPQGQH